MSTSHGAKHISKLVIRNIDTDLNKNGQISIGVIPDGTYTAMVWQTSAEDVERMAKAAGFFDRFSFAKAINTASDDNVLVLPLTFCKAGEKIGMAEDGVTPLTNGKGSEVFEKDFWNVDRLNVTILASDDVQDFAKEITKIVAVDMAKESAKESVTKAREEKRRKELERLGLKKDDATDTGLGG